MVSILLLLRKMLLSLGLGRTRQSLRNSRSLGSLGSGLWGLWSLASIRTTVSRLRRPLGSLSIILEALGILLPD